LAEFPRIVLIDGRSGSGKSELARAVVADWPVAQLLRLDDVYPGWDGLRAAADDLPRVLTSGRATSWDWTADAPGHPIALDTARPVIVEGVGALTRATRPLADLAVWVDLDDDLRRRRALERDGDTYAPHWERWARQEERLLTQEDPRGLADLRVDGSDVRDWRTLVPEERMTGVSASR